MDLVTSEKNVTMMARMPYFFNAFIQKNVLCAIHHMNPILVYKMQDF